MFTSRCLHATTTTTKKLSPYGAIYGDTIDEREEKIPLPQTNAQHAATSAFARPMHLFSNFPLMAGQLKTTKSSCKPQF